MPQYRYLHGFNASWISRYKTEDERLFFGGLWPIQIQSIRIRSTKQNFAMFIRCLHYLDTLVTGGEMYDMEAATGDDVFIIESLMNDLLNTKETKKQFDDYIHSTFDAFTRSKKQIVLNLDQLNEYANKKVLDLFLNTLDQRDVRKEEEMKRECDDLRNLWKPQIFEIFKNVKSVVVMTTYDSVSYSISMDALLSLIKLASLDNVTLKARAYKDNKTWIEDVWCNASETLIKQYGDANYNIEFQKVSDKERQFVIKLLFLP
eukprot:123573_1